MRFEFSNFKSGVKKTLISLDLFLDSTYYDNELS